MPYDSLVLHACVDQLNKDIAGAKVNKIHQPDEHTIILRYRGRESGGRLLLCAHPDNGRIHRTVAEKENPEKAPLFAMVLRKWLEGSRIAGIKATAGERVANITFESHNELGDIIYLHLIVEIMGKHSNIILVDDNGIILDGIRRYGSHLSRYREVLPGRKYVPPPPMDKLPFLPENAEQLAEALYSASDLSLEKALGRQLKGISPILARAISNLAGFDPHTPTDTLGDYDIQQIYRQLSAIDKISGSGGSPAVLMENNAPADYYLFIPPEWENKDCRYYADINEAVDACYIYREEQQRLNREKRTLAKELKHNQQRLEKKILLEEADLVDCQAAEAFKEAADLLTANMYYLHKGMTQAELPSFSDPEKEITVKLDPAKTPQENIQHYYKKYSKAKNAYRLIEEHLSANRKELAYLQSIQQSADDSESINELELITKEACAAGFSRPRSQNRRSPKTAASPLEPRRYLSRDGFVILVGRNNKQNDKLSLKQAKPEDIWLHTCKIPGSHTIIVSEGKTVPESTILEAASYAAWFSKARESGKAPVDYTFAANLKKPNGAVPGYVTYTGQTTVYVEPKQPCV